MIGLVVGTIVWYKEEGSYSFESTVDDMEWYDFWEIFLVGLIWPISLIGLGLPFIFKFIMLEIIRKVKERKDDNTN